MMMMMVIFVCKLFVLIYNTMNFTNICIKLRMRYVTNMTDYIPLILDFTYNTNLNEVNLILSLPGFTLAVYLHYNLGRELVK